MKRILSTMLIALLASACQPETEEVVVELAPHSGVDKTGMDLNVRAQDDFFLYANGTWTATTEIPADQSSKSSFSMLHNKSLDQLQTIIEEAARDASDDQSAAQIGRYYNAYLDVDAVNALGIAPMTALFADIDGLETHADVAKFFGTVNPIGLTGPFNLYIDQDDKSPDDYIMYFTQSGLGLPNRDYYFDESERGLEIRDGYALFVESILNNAGVADGATVATELMALETTLAESQWDKVKNRDADARYNKFTGDEFRALLSNFDTDAYLTALGSGVQDQVIVIQPSYLEAFNEIFPSISVDQWKDYLRLQALNAYAPYLSQDYIDIEFDFYGKILRGREEQLPRWKQAINSINSNLGELVGQLYVDKHFPPEAKARMVGLVNNLILAYAESIANLEWMGDETKEKALDKLGKFTPKIGYPDEWQDYSSLDIEETDLVGNIRRAKTYTHNRDIDKLGKPIDRGEWFLAPQQVNAYYNPAMNEIVFPAAILQPPFFDLDADDARNYGAIGMVIGHEIGHGFDDQGSKYDGNGKLENWWTDEDRARFEELTDQLVAQYNSYEALPDLYVNGELTLGENIGDLGGAAIALRAYEMSLDGADSPIIDGMTGNERFFLGMAQSWRSLYRDEALEMRVKSDPHSPPVFRVNGVVRNIDAYYETFGSDEDGELYLAPEDRVRIWR